MMRLPDIRALLDRHLAGRPTRANFRTGTLTVCTMVPMRSVPHRVVCLVGLDDGVFPRLGVVDGDDVLARDPMTGERDIRSEDRQLLLDAIGAATEKLVITYTGANEYSGLPRPPAVPLAELLDTLDVTTPEKVRDTHRRQTSVAALRHSQRHPRRADPERAVHVRPDRAATRRRPAPAIAPSSRAFISGPLPAPPPDDVALADLVGFFRDPVKGFFRALDFTLPWDVDGVEDAMPVDINALEEWTVGDRMLDDMLRGMDRRPGARRGMAARHLAAGPAGLAQGHRDPRPGCAAGRRPPGTTATPSPTPSTSTSISAVRTAADRHRVPGVRRSAGLGDILQARAVSTCCCRGFRCWRCSLTIPAGTGRRSASAAPKRGTTPRQERLGRPADAAVDLLRRAGRDVRRGPARAAAAADQDVVRVGGGACTPTATRNRPRDTGGRATTTPARIRSRRTSGPGARVPWLIERLVDAGLDALRPPAVVADAAGRWTRRDGRLRSAGPAARRTVDDRAGGQRGHRQDVRVGRPGHAVPRRGRGDAGSDAADHLQASGHARNCAIGSGAKSSTR